jgi:RimK family alpha-L-glutamate ligase
MKSLKEFVSLQEDVKPYNILVISHSAASVRDTGREEPSTPIIDKLAKELSIKIEHADFVGLHINKTSNGHEVNSFPLDDDLEVELPDHKGNYKYQKPIKINPADWIIMPRGLGTLGFTGSRNWYDMMRNLEDEGYFVLNSINSYDLCNSKYMGYLKCLQHDIRTPKTEPIVHSETVEDTVKKLGTDFPIVLKSSTGTQTGVGVVIVESLRSLKALVQMTQMYNKYLPIIIQEFIKIEYDMRVIVCEGEVVGSMRRNVMSDDIRSNASMGATTEEIELTDLERTEAIRIAEEFGGRLVGVDLLPSEDRENKLPYCLEVNANPGLNGIEDISKNSPTKKILEKYKDRSIWPVSTP